MKHLIIPRDLSHWNGKKPQGLQFTNSEYGDRWKHRNPEQYLGIIAGSCYEHDEDYLGPQGNNHFRGILMAYDVQNGSFDEHFVSLKYLKEHYAKFN